MNLSKIKLIILLLFLILLFPFRVSAKSDSFVSIVNPIRGEDFWDQKYQEPSTAVSGQVTLLEKFKLNATWLIRFDALSDKKVIDLINRRDDEKGLFLEITPIWANEAGVAYHQKHNWHDAGSAFLTGYEREEREKLIDVAFERFKETFGHYPVSVGAWWIDSFSLDYMQKKYGIIAALIVADQYTTDNYQIWGQYFSTPFYPDRKNALHPAQTIENKVPVVISQWAVRDPLNGYGNGVFESTFSVQPNDYIDYHNLDINYFSKLVDIYTKKEFNSFGSLIIGLENTYDWSKYKEEYEKQISLLADKSKKEQLNIVTLGDFSSWYQKTFTKLSPQHLIVADDPLGSFKKVVWFMNPYYRAAWFYNQDGSVFRDIRQYIEGEEEICFQNRCDSVNFATFATRVLDEVTYGNKWIIDEGNIADFKVQKSNDKFLINYLNESGKLRTIEFLPRDISIDGKISSIDGAILDAVKIDLTAQKKPNEFQEGGFSWSIFNVISKTAKFILFLAFAVFIPGFVMINVLGKKLTQKIFLASVTGLVLLTLVFYTSSLLNVRFLTFIYILFALLLFIKFKLFSQLKFKFSPFDKLTLLTVLTLAAGTIFQNIPMFRNGLVYPFGMGFWGPNTHDGIWHVSLINQLIAGVPVENPVFAETTLKNYHFFYDLLVAATSFFTKIPVLDLVFRFYPILFSLSLGVGTYHLIISIFKGRIAAILGLYFVYFAGSFGWIVEYIKQKSFGGESAFWANQSASFNLNPPFAISLLIIIAFFLLLNSNNFKSLKGVLIAALLAGSLIGFKTYGAVLILGTLLLIAIVNILKKDFSYLYIFMLSSIFASLIFFSNFQLSQKLIIFSPFWFIHSMIDSPDRVGWARLSLARQAGLESGNWFKFISAEIISLIIFIAGNLGLRILSLLSLLKIKRIFSDNNFLFMLIFSTLSFLIPILFIQSGNSWNTIQFSYYGLYISAVVSGVVLSKIYLKLPRFLSILIIAAALILIPINSVVTASYYTSYLPHARVDQKELEALDFLSRQKDGVVLVFPYDKKIKQKIAEPWPLYAYDSTAYVSALSKKSVYLEDEPQNQILLTDYKKRLITSKDFFLKSEAEFITENNIKYIYLPKVFNIRINEELLRLENIFENDVVIIYEAN